MEIGFIGLGNMGFPIACRLLGENHDVIAFDTRGEALERVVALGAQAATSAKEIADRAETVMASLPSPGAALEVATGATGVIEGSRVKRNVDLSTVGSPTAAQIHDRLAGRNIVASTGGDAGGSDSRPPPLRPPAPVRMVLSKFKNGTCSGGGNITNYQGR